MPVLQRTDDVASSAPLSAAERAKIAADAARKSPGILATIAKAVLPVASLIPGPIGFVALAANVIIPKPSLPSKPVIPVPVPRAPQVLPPKPVAVPVPRPIFPPVGVKVIPAPAPKPVLVTAKPPIVVARPVSLPKPVLKSPVPPPASSVAIQTPRRMTSPSRAVVRGTQGNVGGFGVLKRLQLLSRVRR